MFERLKSRWGIDSNFKLLMILVVFSVSGTSAVFVKNIIFDLIGIDENTPVYLKTILYILTILPAYQILLSFYGFVLGQHKFFREFQKKSIQRLSFRKKK